jgi:hypothetical protein
MATSTDLKLQKFDPAAAKPHRVWLIIGCRGSGKSMLLRDILYKTMGSFDWGAAMTATHTTAQDLETFFPRPFIYRNGYDFEAADKLLRFSKGCVERGRPRKALLLLDDCAFDDKVMKSDTMKEIHLNGRHAQVSLISTTQYCLTVSPLLRANIDYVLVMADNIVANRKRLHQFFFGCFDTFQQFDTVFKHVTRDYGCLVLDNTDKTGGGPQSSVRWYKADPLPAESADLRSPPLWYAPKNPFRIFPDRVYYLSSKLEYLLQQKKQADDEEGAGGSDTKSVPIG